MNFCFQFVLCYSRCVSMWILSICMNFFLSNVWNVCSGCCPTTMLQLISDISILNALSFGCNYILCFCVSVCTSFVRMCFDWFLMCLPQIQMPDVPDSNELVLRYLNENSCSILLEWNMFSNLNQTVPSTNPHTANGTHKLFGWETNNENEN